MKEQAIQKINKIGKISSVVALIAKILVGMGIGLLLVSYIVCMFIPKDSIRMNVEEKMAIEVDMDKFNAKYGAKFGEEEKQAIIDGFLDESVNMEMNGSEVTADQVSFEGNIMRVEDQEETMAIEFRQIANAILALIVGMALVMVTLFFVSGVCKAFRDCTSPFEENVIVKMRNFAYSLIPWLIGSSVISSVGESVLAGKPIVSFSLDLGMLLVVLVLFLLITIFKYGAILQQESDETL